MGETGSGGGLGVPSAVNSSEGFLAPLGGARREVERASALGLIQASFLGIESLFLNVEPLFFNGSPLGSAVREGRAVERVEGPRRGLDSKAAGVDADRSEVGRGLDKRRVGGRTT